MKNLYRTVKSGKIHPILKWKTLTPQNGNFCFGYYDRNPFSKDNHYHLCMKFGQQIRLPAPGEKATIGLIEIETCKFIPIAETYAWCHQQAAMQQWLPHKSDQFIFNDFKKDWNGKWKPISRVYAIDGTHVRDYEFPIYRLSPNGKWAATLNFSRIPRRGYSYALAPLPEDKPVPNIDNDGLFMMNLSSGERKLILPYRKIFEKHPQLEDFIQDGEKDFSTAFHWMTHSSFNSDGTRVMVLQRYQSSPQGWKTFMWTMNLKGNDLICSLPNKFWNQWFITHQLWGRTPREILIDANREHKRYGHEYVVFDEIKGADSGISISPGLGLWGHVIFSPDKKWLLGDSYPHRNNQFLNITRLRDNKVYQIGSFYHDPKHKIDMRCDLHPRWNSDSNFISIDTIHFGERKILLLDIDSINKYMFNN